MLGRLRRNTFTLIVSNAGSALLSFVLAALIGRVLGEEGLGVYTATLAWVFPLSLVVEFGIGTLITRDIAAQPHLTNHYLKLALWERLSFGGLIFAGLILSAPVLSDDAAVRQGLILAAPLVIINPLYGTFTAFFRARQIMHPIAVLNLGMLVAQVTFTVLVFANGGDVLDALLVNTATSAGQMLIAGMWWLIIHRNGNPLRRGDLLGRPSNHSFFDLLHRAYPFALAAVLAALTSRVGFILLEQLTNTGEVGYYAAANRVIEGVRMLPNAFFGALFPVLASLSATPQALNHTFRKILFGLAGFSLAVAVICTPLAGIIIMGIYGEAFTSAEGVLVILAWGFIPSLLRGGQTLYWYARGEEGHVNRVTFAGLILQFALSLWLIPAHGALGLAIVTLISESAMFLALLPDRRA